MVGGERQPHTVGTNCLEFGFIQTVHIVEFLFSDKSYMKIFTVTKHFNILL